MERMGPTSATELLLLPVQLHGIRLGRPLHLLLDLESWRVLGFVVLCGDESRRFLAFAAADPAEHEIAVPSAFLLLGDVDFYLARSRSLRALLGRTIVRGRRELGELRDLLLEPDGSVAALLVEQDERTRTVEPAGATVEPEHVAAT